MAVEITLKSGIVRAGGKVRLAITGVDSQGAVPYADVVTGDVEFDDDSYDIDTGEIDLHINTTTTPVRVRGKSCPYEKPGGGHFVPGSVDNGKTLGVDGHFRASNAMNSMDLIGSGRINNNGDFGEIKGMTGMVLKSFDASDAQFDSQGAASDEAFRVYGYGGQAAHHWRDLPGYPQDNRGTDSPPVRTGNTVSVGDRPYYCRVVDTVGNRSIGFDFGCPEYGSGGWGVFSDPVYGITGYEEGFLDLHEGDSVPWVDVLSDDAGWSGGTVETLSSLTENDTDIPNEELLDYRVTTTTMTHTKTGLTPDAWVLVEFFFAYDQVTHATDVFRGSHYLAKVRFGAETKVVQKLFNWFQVDGSGNLAFTFAKNNLGSSDAICNRFRFRYEEPNFDAITHEALDEGDSLVERYPYWLKLRGGRTALLANYYGGNLMNLGLFEKYDPANKINFINLHNAGETMGAMIASIDDQIISRYNPDLVQIVILEGGANDYTNAGSVIKGYIYDFFQAIADNAPLMKRFATGIPPGWQDDAGSHNLEACNSLIRADTPYDGTPLDGFIDVTIAYDWAGDTGRIALNYVDGPDHYLHLSQTGQEAIAWPTIEAIGSLLPTPPDLFADFTLSAYEIFEGEKVTVKDASNFGFGTRLFSLKIEEDEVSDALPFQIRNLAAGTYNIDLDVTDDTGSSSAPTKTLLVKVAEGTGGDGGEINPGSSIIGLGADLDLIADGFTDDPKWFIRSEDGDDSLDFDGMEATFHASDNEHTAYVRAEAEFWRLFDDGTSTDKNEADCNSGRAVAYSYLTQLGDCTFFEVTADFLNDDDNEFRIYENNSAAWRGWKASGAFNFNGTDEGTPSAPSLGDVMKLKVEDIGSGVKKIRAYLNDVLVYTFSASPNGPADPFQLSPAYNFASPGVLPRPEVSGDGVTNWIWAQAVVNVQSVPQPPVVEMTYPADDDVISGVIMLSGTASDPDGTIDHVRFKVDGISVGVPITSEPYQMSYDTTVLSEGPHEFKLTATDNDSASTTSDPVTAVVDNDIDPPVAGFSITGLTSGNLAAGSIIGITDSSTGIGRTFVYKMINSRYPEPGHTIGTTAAPNPNTFISNGLNKIRQFVSNGAGAADPVEHSFNAIAAPDVHYTDFDFVDGRVVFGALTVDAAGILFTGKIRAVSAGGTSDFSNSDEATSG